MKTLELPEGIYQMNKRSAHDKNALTYVEVGRKVRGEFAPKITIGECFYFTGGSMRDYIRTSLVKDFKIKRGNKVEIITENSIYFLEEVIDDKAA